MVRAVVAPPFVVLARYVSQVDETSLACVDDEPLRIDQVLSFCIFKFLPRLVWKLAGRGKFTDVAVTIDSNVPAKEEFVKDHASCLAAQLVTSMAEDGVEGAEAVGGPELTEDSPVSAEIVNGSSGTETLVGDVDENNQAEVRGGLPSPRGG